MPLRHASATVRALALAGLFAVASCGGDASSTSPGPTPPAYRLHVTKQTTRDTIGARLAGALWISVTDDASRLVARDVTVRVLHDDRFPLPGVTLGAGGDTIVTMRTGTSGATAIDLELGKYAGVFRVAVAAQGVTLPDTTTFTVQPGAVVSLQIPTRDTLITVGATYKPVVFAADRAGNPPLNPPSLSSTRSECAATAATVTTRDIARCIVTVRAGALSDSIAINAIPRIPVVAVVYGNGPWVATMNLDGSALRRIRPVSASIFDPIHPAMGPNGLLAAIDVGGDGKTHVQIIDTTGAARFIPVDLPNGAEQNWPVFSRDGQTLYFSACNWAVFEQCRVWRTRFDGSEPKILTPSTPSSGHRSNWTAVSRDGRLLAYVAYGERLHMLNLQTGADVDLRVHTEAFDFDSTGTKLAYITDSYPVSPLSIANVDGGNAIMVAGGRSFSATPQWLPGGEWILSKAPVGGAPSSPVLVNVTTGELVPIRYSSPTSEIYIVRP